MSEKISCTINGVKLNLDKGTSIIQAFKHVPEEIAHYCWHPGLSVAGVCRLCMVEVEGNPRLQIACNTTVQEGMVISNQSQMVKDSVKWGLNFHLINHPLDCPICDQAGECGLQDQYMKFGQYESSMAQNKVKKTKAVDLGSKIVLDTERCILCSRCVRFTEEVTKTNELGIFNRGDRSEIGTVENKPLENDYAVNTVDICPVGALTSKDFRFKQRVWYLKEKETICHGCSTGCSIKAYHNEEGIWRVRPRHNPEVNDYWMCDKGRGLYENSKPEKRLTKGLLIEGGKSSKYEAGKLVQKIKAELKAQDNPALVLGASYSNEEYEAILNFWCENYSKDRVFSWKKNKDHDSFDGLLLRGDKNANTKGLQQALANKGIQNQCSDLEKLIDSGSVKSLVVAAPENIQSQESFEDSFFSKVETLIWLGVQIPQSVLDSKTKTYLIPSRTFFEKNGTYINAKGLSQKASIVHIAVGGALSLVEFSNFLKGDYSLEVSADSFYVKTNHFVHEKEFLTDSSKKESTATPSQEHLSE